jgi:hypothetical protein
MRVNLLVPAAFVVVSTQSVVKIIAESVSKHDEKYVVPTPRSVIRV